MVIHPIKTPKTPNPDILYKDIDYDRVHEILKREVIESKTWLKNSIESDKKVIVRKKIRDYSDAKDDKRFAKLYKAKNINSYFRALQSVKKDVVYMIAKRGTDNGELAKVRFPRSAEIKKQTKLDILNEGFSLICDYGNRQKISSIDDVSHCYYKENGIESSYEEILKINGVEAVFYRDVYSENLWYLEVFSSKASKKNAVQFLREEYNYDKVICFGDNLNDIPLFQGSDKGYAVENARQELKDIADGVIGANTDNGVAEFLKQNYGKEF